MMVVTREELEQIAQLSKLHLNEEEIPLLMDEITRMVAFADQISAATSDYIPFETFEGVDIPPMEMKSLRHDQITSSLSTKQALQNAKGDENYFRANRRPF